MMSQYVFVRRISIVLSPLQRCSRNGVRTGKEGGQETGHTNDNELSSDFAGHDLP
jgi:hypothetical protein